MLLVFNKDGENISLPLPHPQETVSEERLQGLCRTANGVWHVHDSGRSLKKLRLSFLDLTEDEAEQLRRFYNLCRGQADKFVLFYPDGKKLTVRFAENRLEFMKNSPENYNIDLTFFCEE